MQKPPHATALHLALPHRAWLSAVGMQLAAHSTRTGQALTPNSVPMPGSISGNTGSSSDRNNKDALSSSDSRKGSAAFNAESNKHQCWQPVLVAYGGDSSGGETMSSGREVVRSSPAALSLWAIEAYGKDVAVLSDPACFLRLRWGRLNLTKQRLSKYFSHMPSVVMCAERMSALQVLTGCKGTHGLYNNRQE